jgi:hypothetical protein
LNLVWGFTSGIAQFVLMAMFVQAFWFGSMLVRENKIEPGDVFAVFLGLFDCDQQSADVYPAILPQPYLRLRRHPLVRNLHAKSNLVKSLLSDVLANSR